MGKTLFTSEIVIGSLFFIAIIILLLIVNKDKRHKWNDIDVIPEPSKYNEYISDDIIIRDLITEKEFRAYFDHSRQHYIDYNGNMVWGVFIWRYEN